MSKFKYFPRIEEFDAATNQVRLKDADGIVWVAPLPWFGVIRELSLNTPCVLIQWDDVAHSSDGFPDDQRVKLSCIAFPIYNATRFFDETLTEYPALVGNVSSEGKITSKVTATPSAVELKKGGETLVIDDMTHLGNVEMSNPDVSYGGVAAPQNFILRWRPDFPYAMPELTPSADLLKFARKLVKFIGMLKAS